MSAPVSRVYVRQFKSGLLRRGIRNASSTTEAAKEKAAEASSKASEGLTRVSSSAGSVATKAGDAASSAATSASSSAGGIVGRVQAMVPQVTYYSRVGLELGKLVAHQRGMAPPNSATLKGYIQPFRDGLRQPMIFLNQTTDTVSSQAVNILGRVRSFSNTQWLTTGIVAAEVIGFFTIGEIIGRRKLIGYRASQVEH